MVIRPAQETDYSKARDLFRVLMGLSFDLDQDLFNNVCQGAGYLALVAEDENVGVVGMALVVVTDRIRLSANTRQRRFHIDHLVVFPEHRRRGVGHALLERVVSDAQAQAPSYIIVTCDFTNVAARRTYESAHFHLVRQTADRFELAFA